jgi:ferredoxin
MADVDIKFEREGRDGIVAVGTYLIDAMKRFGIRTEEVCDPAGEHFCAVTITEGADLLSPKTEVESKYFEANGGGEGERLACQVMIERPGSISIMTKKKKEEEAEEKSEPAADFKKEFAEMPLEKKIANLVQLEAITLGDTFSFIANSPYLIFEKIGDIMAEFGMKLERDSKAATRPKEHVEHEAEEAETTEEETVVDAEIPESGDAGAEAKQ